MRHGLYRRGQRERETGRREEGEVSKKAAGYCGGGS